MTNSNTCGISAKKGTGFSDKGYIDCLQYNFREVKLILLSCILHQEWPLKISAEHHIVCSSFNPSCCRLGFL